MFGCSIVFADLRVCLQAAPVEQVPDAAVEAVGFVWAMKVKQGFKCRVYKTPECRLNEV